MTIAEQWRAALADVVVRHPNRESRVLLDIIDSDPPSLSVALDKTWDSRDQSVEMPRPFRISTVALTYFPGETLARRWLAAAWSGYCQHEALELVTVGGLTECPLDPHQPPFMFDRGLRDGFPVELTPETLERALAVAMPPHVAHAVARGGNGWDL